jgi:hypothetical protein
MRVPGEYLGKLGRIDFFTPFDEHALELRVELIRRLGTAMDMPLAALTGEQENHWGKAQTAEEGLRLHVAPDLELVCDALTKGYLRPALVRDDEALLGLKDVPAEGRLLAEATLLEDLLPTDAAGNEIIAWYELEAVRMDRSDDAIAAHDRYGLSNDALLDELGLSDQEPPTKAELAKRVWLKLIDNGSDPALIGLALTELGLVTEDQLPATITSPPAEGGGSPPGAPAPEVGAEPATSPAAPAPSGQPPAVPQAAANAAVAMARATGAATMAAARDAALDVALVAACDGLVHRALERAGNRLRQAFKDRRGNMPPGMDVAACLMHTVCTDRLPRSESALLAEAWERVPGVAGNLGVSAEDLHSFLDSYTRRLLAERQPHTWDALASALAQWRETPAAQVLAVTNGHRP